MTAVNHGLTSLPGNNETAAARPPTANNTDNLLLMFNAAVLYYSFVFNPMLSFIFLHF